MRIILAAEDAFRRRSLEVGLREGGNEVLSVSGGAAALDAAAGWFTDVIIADLVLRGVDGLGIAEYLPGMALPRQPALVLMAPAALAEMARDTEGVDGVLELPVRASEVCARLGKLLSSPLHLPASAGRAISVMMDELGMGRHLRGYGQLEDAIGRAWRDCTVMEGVGERVYAPLGEDKEDAGRVARTMRFAVESVWNAGRVDKLDEMFGYTVRAGAGKPSNSEFIAMMAEYVRMALRTGL